jgi:hypothetical protein
MTAPPHIFPDDPAVMAHGFLLLPSSCLIPPCDAGDEGGDADVGGGGREVPRNDESGIGQCPREKGLEKSFDVDFGFGFGFGFDYDFGCDFELVHRRYYFEGSDCRAKRKGRRCCRCRVRYRRGVCYWTVGGVGFLCDVGS